MKFKSGAIVGGTAAIAGAAATWAALSMLPGTFLAAHAQLSPALLTNGKTPIVTPAMREAASMQSAFNQVAREAAPAVVTITTTERMPAAQGGRYRMIPGFGGRRGGNSDPFGGLFPQFGIPGGDGSDGSNLSPNAYAAPGMGQQVRSGLGSGFIVRADGLILTNAHVVRGADTVTVKLSDGREFKNAKVLGQDEESDVAVIKVPATNLPTVALGDSEDVNVGDWAIAVGNPYGLDHTVTVGVISAKGREVANGDSKTSGEYLQTDASINPGNSGGPLLDIYGKVIGINNSIYSENGGNVGIGFAVPIDTARKIATELAQTGTIRRARLSMEVGEITPAKAQSLGLDANVTGVLVDNVIPGGPAARAGLQAGDVITGINGKTITKMNELIGTVASTPVGGSVKLDVLRNGTHQTITAQPQEPKAANAAAKGGTESADDAQAPGTLGVRLAPLTPDIAQQLGVDVGTKGVVIAGVVNGSPSQAAGLQSGMIIERVGQTPVTNLVELKAAVKAILSKETDEKSVALFVNVPGDNGGREEHYVFVQPQ